MSACFSIDRTPATSIDRTPEYSENSALLHSVPPVASRDLKVLLTDIRDRQEENFRQLLDQHKELQDQLLAMHSVIKANADAQTAITRRQEEAIKAFRNNDWNSYADEEEDRPKRPSEIDFQSTLSVNSRHSTQSAIDVVSKLSGVGSSDVLNGEELYRTSRSGLSLKRQVTKEVNTNSKSCYARTSRFMKSKEFELAIAAAIMCNAFIMCWECQYHGLDVGFNLQYPGRPEEAHVVWAQADTVFLGFDWFFGCLFAIEFLIKLGLWRGKYFYVESRYEPPDITTPEPLLPCQCRCLWGLQLWNLLDFSCVGAFLFDKLSAGIGAINPQMIRLLRLFRLFRMVRLVRFLETLDHLYIMTTAISGVKHVLVWAIVLLTVMLLTCDLFLVQILHATYFDRVKASDLTEDQLKRHHQMYEYFGTCTRCMLSMFEITLGNWPPVARLLSEEASQWFTLFCLGHKLTIGFAVISVISGVILQETFKVAQTDDIIMFRQKKMAGAILSKKLRALFHELDRDGSGKLDIGEVEALSVLPEIKIWLSSLGIETDDVKTLFALIDADGDGYITLEEMVSRMPRLQGGARSIDLLAIQRTLWNNSQKGEAPHQPSMKSCFADFLLAQPDAKKQPGESKRKSLRQSIQENGERRAGN